jgi:hypothetical protein
MGFQSDFTAGIAQLLATANVAVWNPTGTYAPTDTGIMVEVVPPAPDNVVMLAHYVVQDDPTLSDSVIGLQVHTRTGGQDPRTTSDLADAVFDQLHGLHDLTLSTGVRVVEIVRRSGAFIGQDELQRWSRTDNYYATVYRPGPNRL